MTVAVFGYLILISIDFLRFYFYVFSLVLVSIEKIYQTLKTTFDHISKRLEVRQKYSATRRIFNSLLGVCECRRTRSFVFEIHSCLKYIKEFCEYLTFSLRIFSFKVSTFSFSLVRDSVKS